MPPQGASESSIEILYYCSNAITGWWRRMWVRSDEVTVWGLLRCRSAHVDLAQRPDVAGAVEITRRVVPLEIPTHTHISGAHTAEMESGLNLWPVTRPDLDTLLIRWPDPVTECLCFELRDYFDDGVLLMNDFCQKSVVYAVHIRPYRWRKFPNYCKFIKYWKLKIKC